MRNLDPLALNDLANPLVRLAIPERLVRQRQLAKLAHLVVVDVEFADRVAARAQQLDLIAKDLILSAGLLIKVVDDKDVQATSIFGSRCCKKKVGLIRRREPRSGDVRA